MRAVVDCHMVAQPAAGDAGNARYAAALVAALVQEAGPGDDVAALVAHPQAAAELPSKARTARVTASNVRRLALDAPRALRRLGAQAAVFSYVVPPRAPCPLAVAVHDVAFRLHPEWFSSRDLRVLGRLVPRSARRARAVLALSHAAKADLVAALGIAEERVHVVSPYPAPPFTPADGAAERVRTRFALGRYCLVVGDVHPRKNLPALAAAMDLVGDPDLELAIVGRPGLRGREILSETRGRRLGPVADADLADLYRAAAVTCYPSLYEGFGLPVVEAMACGSPLVASARGAIPEVAGDAAILVEPTPEGLAEGIRAALEPATAERLRGAGLARAAHYDAEATGEAAWAVLKEMAL
jgi:glycosyltransferase involved in cell wall biosynthesis